MQFLETLGYILLFIIFLSLLVIVHELGHLSAAKIFKVYCKEFSIGFGPKIFSKKRKKGETLFSLRAIPFGGYVSMFGEGDEASNDENIPTERSFTGIKKYKRAIILVAGVTMNAFLAIVLFFVSNSCFVQKQCYINEFRVVENSPAYNGIISAGLSYEDDSSYVCKIVNVNSNVKENCVLVSVDGKLKKGDNISDIAVVIDGTVLNSYSPEALKVDASFVYYNYSIQEKDINNDGVKEKVYLLENEPIVISNDISNLNFNIDIVAGLVDEEFVTKKVNIDLGAPIQKADDKGNTYFSFIEMGMSFAYYEHWNSFGEAINLTFKNFGTSASAIFRSFGLLFTSSEARQSASGIIGIGFQTSDILKNMGWGRFLYIWGFISVNLAIVNLLPFPGLDGWQLLVLVVEAIAHKEIPIKVKSVISWVGIILLFILMGILLFKDAFTYIF